jgi:peptidyl-prolyl cis-trans isomerase B (cyclophilin B)
MKNIKKIMAAAVATTMLVLTGCGSTEKESTVEKTTEAVKQSGNTIVLTLHTDQAPITCQNFQELVESGFYDGLTFHRVVDDFMAQGGDPQGTGMGGSDKTIKGEFKSNGVENELSHQRGVVSMARSQDPDSASSQFFICYTDCSFLDGEYAAFANVTEGMEVVDDFTKVKRSANSMGEEAVPETPIVMEKVEMIDPDVDGSPRVKITMNDFLGQS